MEFDRRALKENALRSANPIPALKGIADNLLHEYHAIMKYITSRDATLVYTAAEGFGTDDEMMINVLCNRTKPQIELIDKEYRQLAKNTKHKSLTDCVVSETSGNYGHFMKYLTQSRGVFLATQLKNAMDGIGCDKVVVNEIFCTSNSADIAELRKVFEQMTDSNLGDRLRSELGGEHEKLIIHLLQNGRPESPVDEALAEEQAKTLQQMIKSGGTMMGGLSNAAEESVSKYIASISPDQIQVVKTKWEKLFPSSDSLPKTIEKKFGGALEEAVLMLLKHPKQIFSKKLYDAMKGIGCNEEVLSRILGGNHKHICVSVAQEFQEAYKNSLREEIRKETGGNFETALLTWLMGVDPTGGLEPTINYYLKLYPTFTNAPQLGLFIDLVDRVIGNMKDYLASFDADLLKFATKGFGSDERLIVNVLCTKTKAQLDAVDQKYRAKYHQTLKEYINSEMGGDLAEMLSYTQMAEDEFDATVLYKAFKGLGCNKDAVIEVVCTRSAARLQAARAYYEKRYDENLLDRIRSELSGGLEYLVLRMFNGSRGRPDNGEVIANHEAEVIGNGFQNGTWTSDATQFVDKLTEFSVDELKPIQAAYEQIYSESLELSIKKHFSGSLEIALVSLLFDPIDLYCRYIKAATDGVGCDEATISRILGGNDKAIVHRIAKRYFEKYDVQLTQLLSEELFYDYRNACMTYVATADVTGGVEEKLTALVLESHNPPPPPPPKRTPPPKTTFYERNKGGLETAGKVALGAGLVIGLGAAVLVAGPVGVVVGVVALSALANDGK